MIQTDLSQVLYDEVAHDLKIAWDQLAMAMHPDEDDQYEWFEINKLTSRINRLRAVATWLVEDKTAKDHAGIVHRYVPPSTPAPTGSRR